MLILIENLVHVAFSGGPKGEEATCQCRGLKTQRSITGSGTFPGGEHNNPLMFLPGFLLEFQGQRNLVGHRVRHDGSNSAHMHAHSSIYIPKYKLINIKVNSRRNMHLQGIWVEDK